MWSGKGALLMACLLQPKGGACVGRTKKGKGTKRMVVVDGPGVPLASLLESASPAEMKLLEPTLEQLPLTAGGKIKRLILNRGYDSDPLRSRLQEQGIELICPHRRNRKKPKTQDGRKLRRYKRRWKGRTHLCLARKLPPTAGAMGAGSGLSTKASSILPVPSSHSTSFETTSSVPKRHHRQRHHKQRHPFCPSATE